MTPPFDPRLVISQDGTQRAWRLRPDYPPQGDESWRGLPRFIVRPPSGLGRLYASPDTLLKPKPPRKRKTGNPPQRTIRGQVLKRPLIGDPPKPHA